MKKIKILSIVLTVVFISSCSKFLDVNHDPNNTEEAGVELVFPAGVENLAQVVGGSWQILGSIWSQHWTSEPNAPQYQKEDNYGISAGEYAYDLYGWQYLYTRAIMDFEYVRVEAQKSKNWNFFLMSTVMEAYAYQVLVDFFDDIPLLKIPGKDERPEPGKFLKGQAVYDTLIARIDDALGKDFNALTNTKPEKSDVVFQGNIDNWKKFANTLKMKIYLRQRYADGRTDISKQGITKMINEGASFLGRAEDAAFSDFNDEQGRDNYCFAKEFRNGSKNICMSKTLTRYMQERSGKGERRAEYMYTLSATPKAMWQGDIRNKYSYPPKSLPKQYSKPIVKALQPVYFISSVESLLMQAEVALWLGGINGAAIDFYSDAVKEDYKRKEVKDAEQAATDYINLVEFDKASNTPDKKFEIIMMEKWVALANTQGVETFFEHNRSGWPKNSMVSPDDRDKFPSQVKKGEFSISVTGTLPADHPYPQRLLTPSSESNKNPNAPEVEPLWKPVWWCKDHNGTLN